MKNRIGGIIFMDNLYLNFLSYVGVGLVLLIIGTILFVITTRNKEFTLIAQGNKTAAYVLGGRLLGLALVLYSAIANSVSLIDMVIWGGIGIVAQIIAFYLAEILTPTFSLNDAIDKDNQAVGLFLLMLSITIGLVIAGSLTY